MRGSLPASLLLIGLLWAVPAAAAGGVEMRISNGRIWLVATDATIGQILREWSRVGQTEITNGDRVPGGPVTLRLEDVTEEEALDVLLRAAAGYMGVRRTMPVIQTSGFARILILPTGTNPSGRAATVPLPESAPQPVFADPVFAEPVATQPESEPVFDSDVQRVIGPDGLPVPDDQEGAPPPPRDGGGPPGPLPQATPIPFGVPVPGMFPKPILPVGAAPAADPNRRADGP